MEPFQSLHSYRLLLRLNKTALLTLLTLAALALLVALARSGLEAVLLLVLAMWPLALGMGVLNALLALYNGWRLLNDWIHGPAQSGRWAVVAGGLLAALGWVGLAKLLLAGGWGKISG